MESGERLNGSDWSDNKCREIVERSTVTLELGRITGSFIRIDRIGSKKSSGGLTRASSLAFCRCSIACTLSENSLISAIKSPPPILIKVFSANLNSSGEYERPSWVSARQNSSLAFKFK